MSENLEASIQPQTPEESHSVRIPFEKWINPQDSRNKKVDHDLMELIEGDYLKTMSELAKATGMRETVKTMEQAKNLAAAWLGFSPTNSYRWLLHTPEMEAMLKQVFLLDQKGN